MRIATYAFFVALAALVLATAPAMAYSTKYLVSFSTPSTLDCGGHHGVVKFATRDGAVDLDVYKVCQGMVGGVKTKVYATTKSDLATFVAPLADWAATGDGQIWNYALGNTAGYAGLATKPVMLNGVPTNVPYEAITFASGEAAEVYYLPLRLETPSGALERHTAVVGLQIPGDATGWVRFVFHDSAHPLRQAVANFAAATTFSLDIAAQ